MNYSVLDFLKTFGINTKTNFDLKEYSIKLDLPVKIIMNDELHKINKTKKNNVIINYQNSNKNGSHWVCFKNRQLYFDSYGIKPTDEVEEFLNKDYIYNKLQVQPNNTNICGVLCLYVLLMLNKTNLSFENIVDNIYKDLEPLLRSSIS